MALTNSRPLQIPALENEALHNSASPVFQPSSLSSSSQSLSSEGLAERSNSSATSESSNENSISETPLAHKDLSTLKRSNTSSPVPSSGSVSELSITVPVTGQRPKPIKKDLSMDDDILLAIFVILYENDPQQKGVTVKQLCDFVAEKHPDMAGASTKLSNLISAKLNAYVKKVEKGEKTLKYALSRQWSEGSPRRMVYVYRGVLASDYKAHTQSMMLQRQESKSKAGKSSGNSKRGPSALQGSNNSTTDAVGAEIKNSSQGARTFAVNNTFSISSFGSDFNIPYATAPVTMRLIPNTTESNTDVTPSDSSRDLRLRPSFSEPVSKRTKVASADATAFTAAPYITAAAAAPRLSKLAAKRHMGIQDPAVLGAASGTQKVISSQKPIESSLSFSHTLMEPFSPILACNSWLQTIRSGFLLEEIDSPEAISVEEFDGLFS
ncbi:LAME_0B01068g1_1 [Lachancea meyersii CBS 8951]|uniref:LAME_0B01068g1_1 n=1 Tax=Lachancea meyersii CBS 8951 TaxID=1266667 RepID=A0A1G4ISP5_9SACH|nr:LAME_0B01068g1_1 [Lachancea meyersii CBS 8951]